MKRLMLSRNVKRVKFPDLTIDHEYIHDPHQSLPKHRLTGSACLYLQPADACTPALSGTDTRCGARADVWTLWRAQFADRNGDYPRIHSRWAHHHSCDGWIYRGTY